MFQVPPRISSGNVYQASKLFHVSIARKKPESLRDDRTHNTYAVFN